MTGYEVSATIQRCTETSDGAGGVVETWVDVATATATKHFYRRRSQFREEPEPGALTVQKIFFKFEPPFPTVESNNRILAGGETFLVKHVRTYVMTMQVDCEIVE